MLNNKRKCVIHEIISVNPCCRLRASLLWSLPEYKVILTRIITIPVVNLSCTGMLALFTHFKFEEGFLKRIEKKKRTKPAIHQRRAELLPQQRIKARRISW